MPGPVACGVVRPRRARDDGGLATLVVDGATGRLLGSRSVTAWADAVEWATSDALRAMRLSTAAVLRAQPFTWRAAATRLDAVVESVRDACLVSCA